MAHPFWWEVVGKRWIRCGVVHAAISTVIWLMWECSFSGGTSSRYYEFGPLFLASVWGIIRFLVFQSSQVLFLLGKAFILQPEEVDAASVRDLLSWVVQHTWWLIVGPPLDKESNRQAAALHRRIRVTGLHCGFLLVCALSGLLGVFSLVSALYGLLQWRVVLELSVQGAMLGLVYFCFHLYWKQAVLTFPIIQRLFYFAFKLAIPIAVNRALQISGAAVFFGLFRALLALRGNILTALDYPAFARNTLLFSVAAFFTVLSWELGHHLIQVVHTKHHKFAPPLGSVAAETDPTEPLLTALRDSEDHSILRYLAYLDLCMVAETNVDTWRRAALFEETAETYKTIIGLCLSPIDALTSKLAGGLEGFHTENGHLMKQMLSPNEQAQIGPGIDSKGVLNFQLCSWCARTVASLTAISRYEDRFGVAQLSGSNGAVISSLLSCLLVLEVYLGRRSHTESSKFVGPNSIRWTMPSRGGVLETVKKPGFLFPKNTAMHRKGHALADVLRVCIYRIVAEFEAEMLTAGVGGKAVIAEKDWMSPQRPHYGNHELLAEKLLMFLEYRVT